jgi:hypothetical protein
MIGTRYLLVLAVIAVVAGGCGTPNVPLTSDQLGEAKLRDVGELYRVHQLARKTPPKTLKDFTAEADSTPSAFEAIRSGDVVIRYGATLPDAEKEEPGNGSATEVLAWLKSVPETGGPVLMLDRTIKKLTAEEFKSAPKAGKD